MQEMPKEKLIHKNRWVILFIVALLPFMSALDASIVNVALPTLSNTLNVDMHSVEWVVTSYLITVSAFIIIFGRIGDIKGTTTVFKAGLLIFTLGSLLCGISASLPMLVVSRVVQAVGASCTMSTNQGIVTQVFPPNERGRALGIAGTFVALGAMTGPALGGLIISILSWNYIFLVNIPIGIVVSVMAFRVLPVLNEPRDEKLDVKGSLIFAVSVILIFVSINIGQRVGFGNPFILTAIAGAAALFALFVIIENKTEYPLLELSIFKNRLFSLSVFCAFISFVATQGINFIMPFYLENARELPHAYMGLILMVFPITMSAVAPISGYISDKIGSELLTFAGLCVMSVGMWMISTLTQNSPLVFVGACLAVCALGHAIFQSPNTALIMSTVDRNHLGVAGSINGLARNMAFIIGVLLATTVLYSRMSYKIGYKVLDYVEGRDDVFLFGMTRVFVVSAAICLFGAFLTAIRLAGKRKSQRGGL